MKRTWVCKPIPASEQIDALSNAININSAVATLLLQREISTFDEAKAFFRPSLYDLHDPFLMQDMEKAIVRLNKAIQTQEKILIYGDYDVDGTTSVALVYGFLKKRYANIEFYIPDRYKEGYGISNQSIYWAADNGIRLIISLDCGIKANTQVQMAETLGIDFIICDHHQPGDALPNAHAVLDAKRDDCSYPFKELSGCGVGFKLLQAFCKDNPKAHDELLSYLDLVAISIASDIVPITGENRILTYYGLKLINQQCRAGIKALIEIAGYQKKMEVMDVVFGLGPRINAAGRIAHAKGAVLLMLADNEKEAAGYAQQLNEKNITRKDVDASITSEALQMIESNLLHQELKSTVLFKETWHKGVIGIVASRCIEKHYKPTIIFTESNEMATGSARSVEGFDVYDAISQCADLLVQYGGHKYAAGLTLKKENINAFREKFETVVSGSITREQLVPRLNIDMKINLNQVNYKLYNIMRQMAPFGPGNMQPVFSSEAVYDDGRARVLKECHLKIFLLQDENTLPVEAIGFGMASSYAAIAEGKKFNICYTLCENDFNGDKSLQLVIKDLEFI